MTMRVLMVNQFFYPFLGGAEFHIQHLGVELTRLGCAVTVAHGPAPGASRPAAPFPEEFRGLRLRPLASPWRVGAVMDEGFDIVHAHMPRNAWTLAGLRAARRRGIPTVLTPFAFYPSSDLLWHALKAVYDATLLRYTFRLTDRVICLTECDRADAVARGLAPGKARVIPTAVPTAELAGVAPVDFRAKYGIPWDFVLFVGRFDRVKHIEFLVRAQAHIGSVGLVLIGSDDGRLAAVRRLVAELGLEARVRIIERAPLADLCGAYRQARALVLASEYEGLGIVILEAWYFGCPVVASRVGGVPYVVRDPAPGLTYAFGRQDEYLAAVRATLARGRDTEGAGRRLVEREYAWDVNARRTLDVYRELAGAGTAGATPRQVADAL